MGYHLVTILEPPRTVMRPLPAVAGEIRNKLKTQARKKELERLLAGVNLEIGK